MLRKLSRKISRKIKNYHVNYWVVKKKKLEENAQEETLDVEVVQYHQYPRHHHHHQKELNHHCKKN